MHPLLDSLTYIKSALVKQHAHAAALDVYTLPNDMQIYSSCGFEKLIVVSLPVDDKNLRLSAPSKPAAIIAPWQLRNQTGRALMHVSIAFARCRLSCTWINLHRNRISLEAFRELLRSVHTHSEDGANLFIVCVDGRIAHQFARARQVYVDRDNNMMMQYHRQSLDHIPVEEVTAAATESGFTLRSCKRGDQILHDHGINTMPYDLWSSQTFFFLEFQSRLHLLRHL